MYKTRKSSRLLYRAVPGTLHLYLEAWGIGRCQNRGPTLIAYLQLPDNTSTGGAITPCDATSRRSKAAPFVRTSGLAQRNPDVSLLGIL